ncbi:MAG: acyl-CoA dehydrogenase [Burkholderiales bacterium]|jgi:acyl-CoA dehydrogenase
MFAEAIEDILKDQCTPAAVRAIEAGGSPAGLWDAIADAGFLELLAPEADGGAGLPLAELFPVLTTLGRYATPVPIAQSIAARALLSGKAEIPAGMLTLASACRRTSDGQTTCPITPFGMLADHVLADDEGTLVLLSCDGARRSSVQVHGNLSATLTWKADVKAVRIDGLGSALPVFGAALHAALLCGAMSRVFEMTLQYANDRSQFGRSIGKFQAIQHQISVMAEHVAAASVAAEAAFSGDSPLPSLLPAAIAKSRTSEATVLVASIAHAVHGAIGITEEYDLQLLTRRLHEWRIAHGSEAYWNMIVGRSVLASTLPTVTDFVRSVDPAN